MGHPTPVKIVFRGLIAFNWLGNSPAKKGMEAYLVNRKEWRGTENDHKPRLEAAAGLVDGTNDPIASYELPRDVEVTFWTTSRVDSPPWVGRGTGQLNEFSGTGPVQKLQSYETYVPHFEWFFIDKAPKFKVEPSSHQGVVILPPGDMAATELVQWANDRNIEPTVPQLVEFANVLEGSWVDGKFFYLAQVCVLNTEIDDDRDLIVQVSGGDQDAYYQAPRAENGDDIPKDTIEVTIRNNSPQLPAAPPFSVHYKAFLDVAREFNDKTYYKRVHRSPPNKLSQKWKNALKQKESVIGDVRPYPRLHGVMVPSPSPLHGTQDRPLCIPIGGGG